MLTLTSLPRDLQILVLGKLDMDARIRCGLVFKLRVPDDVASRINASLRVPEEAKWNMEGEIVSVIAIGPRLVPLSNAPTSCVVCRYIICRYTPPAKDVAITWSTATVMNHRSDGSREVASLVRETESWTSLIII